MIGVVLYLEFEVCVMAVGGLEERKRDEFRKRKLQVVRLAVRERTRSLARLERNFVCKISFSDVLI